MRFTRDMYESCKGESTVTCQPEKDMRSVWKQMEGTAKRKGTKVSFQVVGKVIQAGMSESPTPDKVRWEPCQVEFRPRQKIALNRGENFVFDERELAM